MRHRKKGKKLSRKKPHRNHLVRNLITQILLHSRIKTTLSKAKAVKPKLEKVITRSLKEDGLSSKRYLKSYLYDDQAVDNLLTKYSSEFKQKSGGYSRIVKLGKRKGDGSAMALIDLKVSSDVRPEKRSEKEKKAEKQTDKKKADKDKEEKGSFWDRFKSGQKKQSDVKGAPSDKDNKPGKDGKIPSQRTTSK